MSEELEALKLLSQHLRKAGIPFMVTGSIALNHYATPRMTRDIDLVVEMGAGHVSRLTAALGLDWHADPEEIGDAVRRAGMFNLIHRPSVVKVDLVVRKDEPYRREEFSRRRMIRIDEEEIAFVAPEDLLLSKLCWAKESRSEVQLKDARALLHGAEPLDRNYLERWARSLGVWDLYQEVRDA